MIDQSFDNFLMLLIAWGHASRGTGGPRGLERPGAVASVDWNADVQTIEDAMVLLKQQNNGEHYLTILKDYYYYAMTEHQCAQRLKLNTDLWRFMRGRAERSAWDIWGKLTDAREKC